MLSCVLRASPSKPALRAAAVVSLLIPASGGAQESVRPAEALFSADYRAEIGRTVPEPVAPRAAPGVSMALDSAQFSSCQATCDAFVLRQPILSVEWENAIAGTAPDASASEDSGMRIDISGTATGFAEGDFGTIRLSRIPVAEEVVLDPVQAIAVDGSEALLNRVEDGRVMERAGDLPIFATPDVMNQALSSLQPDVLAKVEADQRTGALSQIRVLGRGSAPVEGASHQIVTMVGLQPGATYRLRLVEEDDAAPRAVFEQICRIPVCPADFLLPGN